MARNLPVFFRGCLLGGAVGDALGWPIEFDCYEAIRGRFGDAGIRHIEPNEEYVFEITDDTQMTLFTAEGLLRAVRTPHDADADFTKALWCAYLGWLRTQGVERCGGATLPEQGWLSGRRELFNRRAPGGTCLSALSHGVLTPQGVASNDSKGCGGVMRAAPAGLLAARLFGADAGRRGEFAFQLGCAAAALTHGNPAGYHPAGALAALIATILCGASVEEGARSALALLDGCPGSQETAAAVRAALQLWGESGVAADWCAVESLGGGWIGSEALAIGLYGALAAGGDFADGVRLAVNHSGDSDSTGSIAGNILGALLGADAIPCGWLQRLELADVIAEVADDLYRVHEDSARWRGKYPLPSEGAVLPVTL